MLKRRRWIAILLLLVPFLGCDGSGVISGDRVLVAKCLYETGVRPPERFNVVVFKFPNGPVKRGVPTNYIKRLLGLPGEIIAIFFGQIFRMTPGPGDVPGLPVVEDSRNLWKSSSQPHDAEFRDAMKDWFAKGRFQIVRKPPEVMMAMRRIVNDNNYQPADMKHFPSRWQPRAGSGWSMSADRKSFSFKPGAGDDVDWLTYQHLVRPEGEGALPGNIKLTPKLITDVMGYNNFNGKSSSPSWVGDLMLEARVNVTQSNGEFLMELNHGVDLFQARFEVATGLCTLKRIPENGPAVELASKGSPLRGPGNYAVRFANFDGRLTVWVDRTLVFENGVDYTPPEQPSADGKGDDDFRQNLGPRDNDLKRPASLGGKGAGLDVSDVRLWRDTYYTMDYSPNNPDVGASVVFNPDEWSKYRQLSPHMIYVYPGHYLCLGDNSTHSSDGREWGLVPDRLMLGRALSVYYPIDRAGLIR